MVYRTEQAHPRRTARRGARRAASLLMVVIVVTGLAMVTSAVLPQMAAQARQATDSVASAKALQAAEAGAEYEAWWISHAQPPHDINPDASNGYKGECPPGSDNRFRVGVRAVEPGSVYVIWSEGTSGGVVRRVELRVKPAAPPFALYGISGAADSVNMRGTTNTTGTVGTNGTWDSGSNTTITKGPMLLAGNNAKVNNGSATIQNPVENPLRSMDFSLQWSTVTGIANSISGSTQGVRWFRNRNDNNAAVQGGTRGVFYVYRNASGQTTERPFLLGSSFTLSKSAISAPSVSGFNFVAVKFYPGNYYFTDISLNSNTPTILIDNRPTSNGSAVNWWVDSNGAGDPRIQISPLIDLVDRNYPGRFWIYSRGTGGVRVAGNDQPFYANIYYFDIDANGVPYGKVDVDSNSTLYGTIISWNMDIGGGASIIMPTGAGEDTQYNGPLAFMKVVSWGEL